MPDPLSLSFPTPRAAICACRTLGLSEDHGLLIAPGRDAVEGALDEDGTLTLVSPVPFALVLLAMREAR